MTAIRCTGSFVRCGIACFVVLALCGGDGLAQVRALKETPTNVLLGTEAFSLNVDQSGTLRNIKVGETVLWSFVGIYSNPNATEDDKPVRCCQAESPGLGDRPPQMTTQFAGGNATVTITRDCSHPKLYNNEPFWRLKQTVLVQPDGLVRVTYNCKFLRYLSGMSWQAVFAGAMPEFTGRKWTAQVPNMTLSGAIPAGLPKRGDLEGAWEVLLDSSKGPVKMSFGDASRVEMADWGQYLQVGAMLPDMPYGGPVYRGVERELTVSVQLPIK